jgi:hypothetical protein
MIEAVKDLVEKSDKQHNKNILVSAEDLAAKGISEETFQFDYNRYVETYEASKHEERALNLAAIQAMADTLAETEDPNVRSQRSQEFHNFADPINDTWGKEFDRDIINFLEAMLIMHKDLTIVMLPGTQLYWYDKLKNEVYGSPSNHDTYYYVEETGQHYQDHPGRDDKESIIINTYELPESAVKVGHRALSLVQAA